jgi:anthranilate phosphoribosyltransferase
VDEITTTGTTWVAELKDGRVRRFELRPEDFGMGEARPDDIRGGSGEENAAALSAVLDGAPSCGPYRDVALANAAAALLVAGRAERLDDAVALARNSLDSGRARRALERLVAVSNA